MTTDPRSVGRTYSGLATAWGVGAAGAAAWGLFAAFRLLPWQSVLAVFLAAGLLAGSLALSSEAVVSDRIDLWRAGRMALLAGLLAVAAVGIVNRAGTAGLAVLAVLALPLLSRPGVRRRLREAWDRPRRRRDPDEQEWPDEVAGPRSDRGGDRDDAWDRTVAGSLATEPERSPRLPVADVPLDTAPDWSPTLTVPTYLSTQDLCLAWESSSRALRRCASVDERLEVVRVRQACLDELERRHPEAVRAWVLAGADPDSSPARYLAG